ncbi:MAG: AMMECR1 domain-containing protein [Candidatus Paceibacterota bacterium]|jgi:AMMECR1 domain-containing protein
MLGFFTRFREEFRDFFYTEQLDSFFLWLSRKSSSRGELVYLDLPHQEGYRDCASGKEAIPSAGSTVSFIICEPGMLQEVKHADTTEKSWFLLFYSPRMEIWEDTLRHTGTLPLRFGIREEEKRAALALAKSSMLHALGGKEDERPLSIAGAHTGEIATVDVAIWIDGKVRGSIVIGNRPLYEGITIASRLALCDGRFKPVSFGELRDARVEIQIMSDVQIRLSEKDIAEGFVDGRKGYRVSYQGRNGWYLPTVFNCVKFNNLEGLTKSLAGEKAYVPKSDMRHATFSTFLVQGFIEEEHTLMNLDGPVALPLPRGPFDLPREALRCGNASADWLLKVQDPDGYMALYIDPFNQKSVKTDWARMAFTAQALAYYGQVVGNPVYASAAKKTFSYLSRYAYDAEVIANVNKRLYVLIFLGTAAVHLDEKEEVKKMAVEIRRLLPQATYDPIMRAHLATLLCLLAEKGIDDSLQDGIEIAEKTYADFEERKDKDAFVQLAFYPELVYTFSLLFAATGREEYLEKSRAVAKWLKGQQFENGAFPIHPRSLYSYTRGTGKMLEVLAIDMEAHGSSAVSAFRWLTDMQYSEANTYFVPPEFRRYIIGGFRYDYANPDAWIDGAGHFLIGVGRILALSTRAHT